MSDNLDNFNKNFEKMAKWYQNVTKEYPNTMLPNTLPKFRKELVDKSGVERAELKTLKDLMTKTCFKTIILQNQFQMLRGLNS